METIETLGKYEIRRSLGRGAAGVVYEGWDPVIARRVAIKTVRIPSDQDDPETQEQLARFRREAQAAGRLIHPNIVGVFDYGETNDLAYIVMEFVDGPTVRSLLDNHERFALAETLRIMGDILAGLQYSHDRGVVHRDIKPTNVMLTADGQAKIADFGIARIESSSMTQAGTVMGTPSYMSPEQFMGQTVDARSDIYSAGVMLYQLLTGDRPFEGSLSAIMHKVLHTEPPAPSQLSVNVPPAFDAVVAKAMAKRPWDRFQTATAFLEAIRAAAAGQPLLPADADGDTTIVAAQPAALPAAPVAPTPNRRSTRPLLAGVAVALLAVGAAAWLGWFRNAPPRAPPPNVAPQSVPASPQPAPANPPASNVAPVVAPLPPEQAAEHVDIRQQLAQLVAAQSCSVIDGEVHDGGAVTLTGLAGLSSADALRQGLSGLALRNTVNWGIGGVDPVFCPALAALHPILPLFSAAPRLMLSLAGGRTRLHDGERILPRLTMADFAGSLSVDYVAHNGSVQHLYPQVADAAAGLGADPVRSFNAGEAVSLGDPKPGHPPWEAGEPYGVDMIIAIASSRPLFDAPRPGNAETAGDYLSALQAAIARAQGRGDRLTGAAMLVETLPKSP